MEFLSDLFIHKTSAFFIISKRQKLIREINTQL